MNIESWQPKPGAWYATWDEGGIWCEIDPPWRQEGRVLESLRNKERWINAVFVSFNFGATERTVLNMGKYKNDPVSIFSLWFPSGLIWDSYAIQKYSRLHWQERPQLPGRPRKFKNLEEAMRIADAQRSYKDQKKKNVPPPSWIKDSVYCFVPFLGLVILAAMVITLLGSCAPKIVIPLIEVRQVSEPVYAIQTEHSSGLSISPADFRSLMATSPESESKIMQAIYLHCLETAERMNGRLSAIRIGSNAFDSVWVRGNLVSGDSVTVILENRLINNRWTWCPAK